jgi:hypothetical protein
VSARSSAERAADREIRTATLIMELCDEAGVSLSPSTVRQRLAAIIGTSCSHATQQRLHLALEADKAARS